MSLARIYACKARVFFVFACLSGWIKSQKHTAKRALRGLWFAEAVDAQLPCTVRATCWRISVLVSSCPEYDRLSSTHQWKYLLDLCARRWMRLKRMDFQNRKIVRNYKLCIPLSIRRAWSYCNVTTSVIWRWSILKRAVVWNSKKLPQQYSSEYNQFQLHNNVEGSK